MLEMKLSGRASFRVRPASTKASMSVTAAGSIPASSKRSAR
jgi:hypothetical protein